jgi:lysophospholipase L1-like esterase
MGLAGAEIVLRLTDKQPVRAPESTPEAGTVNMMVPDPELGFRLNPELPGVSSRGLYGKEIPARKTPGVPRVLTLGDSVTVSCDWQKNTPETFLARLEQRLAGRVELVNAATSGYTIYQERLQLERHLDLEPDLVVLQYTLNDNAKFLHQFDADRQILLTEEARKIYVENTAGTLGWLAQHSTLALRTRFALRQWTKDAEYPWEKYPGFPQAWSDTSWTLVDEELDRIVELSAASGAPVIVLAAPFGPQFEGQYLQTEREKTTYPQRRLAEICASKGVEMIDLLPVFEKSGGASLFYDLVHMTAEGHRLTAEALAPAIERAISSD